MPAIEEPQKGRSGRKDEVPSENSLRFKYRLIPPPPVEKVITTAPPVAQRKVYSYSPLPPNPIKVVNSLPPLKKPEFGYPSFGPPAYQYPGYFPEPYIIEKPVSTSSKKEARQYAIKTATTSAEAYQERNSFPKEPKKVVPPPDIEHVAPPADTQKDQRKGKSNFESFNLQYIHCSLVGNFITKII